MEEVSLPTNNIAKYDGKVLNWFIGDGVPKYNYKRFWAFGAVGTFNTIKAEYCGVFDWRTRKITEIKKLKK